MLLLVGENDHSQCALRKRYHGVDLYALQGEGRRERSANWFSELQHAAATENIQLRCRLRILKHTAHRINQRFIRTAMAFLNDVSLSMTTPYGWCFDAPGAGSFFWFSVPVAAAKCGHSRHHGRYSEIRNMVSQTLLKYRLPTSFGHTRVSCCAVSFSSSMDCRPLCIGFCL